MVPTFSEREVAEVPTVKLQPPHELMRVRQIQLLHPDGVHVDQPDEGFHSWLLTQ
jgi:hypothetical protein